LTPLLPVAPGSSQACPLSRFVKDGLLASVLEALLSLKSLVIQKTKLTTSCAQELGSLLNTLLEAGEGTQRSFVRACMSALEAHTSRRDEVLGGQRAAAFIMNQLCDVVSDQGSQVSANLTYLIRGQLDVKKDWFYRIETIDLSSFLSF
jgi:hypothetical protein